MNGLPRFVAERALSILLGVLLGLLILHLTSSSEPCTCGATQHAR